MFIKNTKKKEPLVSFAFLVAKFSFFFYLNPASLRYFTRLL